MSRDKIWVRQFCKAHEQSIRTLLHTFRVIRADATDESDTYIHVNGLLTECTQWINRRKKIEVNEVGYAVSRSPPLEVSGSSCRIEQNRLFAAIGSRIDKSQSTLPDRNRLIVRQRL
jgi:hypothetical protein